MTHHNAEFIMYTFSLFFICNTKVSRPRAAMGNCLLYTGLCPLRDTSLEIFFPPLLLFPICSLPFSLNPSSARCLPPIFPSRCPCLIPSLYQPSLPPLTLSPCLASFCFLPPSPRSLSPSPSSLPTTLHPSLLLPDLLAPCLHAYRRPYKCTQCVLFGQLHGFYCINSVTCNSFFFAASQAWHLDNGGVAPVSSVASMTRC